MGHTRLTAARILAVMEALGVACTNQCCQVEARLGPLAPCVSRSPPADASLVVRDVVFSSSHFSGASVGFASSAPETTHS